MDEMRLNKMVAQAINISRRKADCVIKDGNVKVNNKVVLNPGVKALKSDKIEINGKIVRLSNSLSNVYLLFYKPRGVITTCHDERGRKTVFDLLPQKYSTLKPVGRLDRDSEGLLLLSNNGNFINYFLHPRNKVKKTYMVTLQEKLTKEEISFDSIKQILIEEEQGENQQIFKVVLHEGANREIRKLFQRFGYTVKSLKRIEIGPFKLGDLRKGEYIELREEVVYGKCGIKFSR